MGELIVDAGAAASTSSVATIAAKVRGEMIEENPYFDSISSYTAGATTVTMGNPAAWAQGDWFEWDDGTQDQVRVTSAAAGTNPVPIAINFRGTPNVSHSAGLVRKRPRYSYDKIARTIAECVNTDLWPWVWTTGSCTVTPLASPTSDYYDVDAAYEDALQVMQQTDTTITSAFIYQPDLHFVDRKNLPAFLSTTGRALMFSWIDNFIHPINVFYRARITTSTIPTGSLSDLVTMGTCARMSTGREFKRGGDENTKPAETIITPGAFLRTGAYYKQVFEQERRRIHLDLQRSQRVPRRFVRQNSWTSTMVNF